jgi:hypothetical protein
LWGYVLLHQSSLLVFLLCLFCFSCFFVCGNMNIE